MFLETAHEGGVRKNRGIQIPPNLRAGPERLLTVGYTASNSYLNPGLLVCFDRSCELEYESDHTANIFFASFRQPFLRAFEIGFATGTYEMNNLPDAALPQQLASDRLLRSFHQNWLREDSLAVQSDAPDGRQVFTMTDLAGRRLTLEPEHIYVLPLRIDLSRYFEFRASSNARMTLNAGLHVSVPLEGDLDAAAGKTAFARGIDFGISADFVRTRRITERVSSSFHVQVARLRHDVHVVNPNSPWHGDDLSRSQYALTYGLRFNGTFDGRAPCAVAMSQVTTTAHYDKDRYWSWDPLVFEGGNNLRGAILGANDYGVVAFGCEYRRRRYQLSLVEDIGGFSQFLTDDGSGTSYDPDFAVGLSVSWVLGAHRDRGG